MSRLDVLGDRTCMALAWIGALYIVYAHVLS